MVIGLQRRDGPERLYRILLPAERPESVSTVEMRRRIIRLGREQPVEEFKSSRRIAPPRDKYAEIVQDARIVRVQFERRAIGRLCLFRVAGLLIGQRPFDQYLKIAGSHGIPDHVRPEGF